MQEFVSYWPTPGSSHFLSLIASVSPTGPAVASNIARPGIGKSLLVANTLDDIDKWTTRCRWTPGVRENAFLLRLRELPWPPPFQTRMTGFGLFRLLTDLTPDITNAELLQWISKVGTPLTISALAPQATGDGTVVFGIRIAAPLDANKRIIKGFRPGKLPRKIEAMRTLGEKATRIEARRMDSEYALRRGGGRNEVQGRSACLIGCGAVGGFISHFLAAAGLSQIVLIDFETFEPDNLHRHVLGASHLGQKKAVALGSVLTSSYPNLEIKTIDKDIAQVLDTSPKEVELPDVRICAIGNDVLERRINQYFWPNASVFYTWVEPLGTGGHSLMVLPNQNGCFECMYRIDERFGLTNMASLLAPGQDVERNIDGCGGTFAPFSYADALRTAMEAASHSVRYLMGKSVPQLVTWIGDLTEARAEGLTFSDRCKSHSANSTVAFANIGRPDCLVCRESPT